MGYKTEPSLAAVAASQLQRVVPGARVVYLSATGATDPANTAYLDRLGLWGTDTAFATKGKFISEISSGGVAAMELFARDLKQLGLYISRNLSFKGVDYDRLEHNLSPEQREIYDKLAEGWQVIIQNFDAALELTASRMTESGKTIVDRRVKAAARSALYGAIQRFFNTVITSMQMPSVLLDMEKEMAAGNCCVLQLVNTNESVQDRLLGKMDEDDDLADIDFTPREQILQLLEHCFPVNQYEEYVDESERPQMRLVVDGNGNPVKNAEAVEMRDNLMAEIGSIRVPEGPLEIILNYFGVDNVSEVTGRRRRIVKRNIAGIEKTLIETRSPNKCLADIEAFRNGRTKILIFSDAGGTGASYHADPKYANRARRVHYLLQAGWVADQAVQGFGRTHRSHQVCAPMYKLVHTDLKAQKRFISTIARRLDQLGALTRGQRQAASTGIFEAADNLESIHAKDALRRFFVDLYSDRIKNLSMAHFCSQTGLTLIDHEGNLLDETPKITQFLNRLLNVKIDQQNEIFDAYFDRLMSVIQQAKDAGTLDLGIETVRADRIEKIKDQVVYEHEETKAQTRHVELKLYFKNHPLTFDDLISGSRKTHFKKVSFFARNTRSGRIYAFTPGHNKTEANGNVTPQYREFGPLSDRPVPISEIRDGENWERIDDPEQARTLWNKQVDESPKEDSQTLHLITGAVLPIWDRLPRDYPRVKRLQITETREKLLGRVIPHDQLDTTLQKLGVFQPGEGQKWESEVVLQLLRAGSHIFKLSNGWLLKSARTDGERRIEIVGPTFMEWKRLLERVGVFMEKIQFIPRFFIPDSYRSEYIIDEVTKNRPIIEGKRTR